MVSIRTFLIFALSIGCFSEDIFGSGLIGYGSANTVLPAKDQEWFYRGFDVGFSKSSGKKMHNIGV